MYCSAFLMTIIRGNMKIKLSKSQWEGIGKQAGWNDVEQTNGTDESEETVSSILYEVKSGRMDIP